MQLDILQKILLHQKSLNKCLIQLAYAIGISKPLSIYVDLFDDDEEKSKYVEECNKKQF